MPRGRGERRETVECLTKAKKGAARAEARLRLAEYRLATTAPANDMPAQRAFVHQVFGLAA